MAHQQSNPCVKEEQGEQASAPRTAPSRPLQKESLVPARRSCSVAEQIPESSSESQEAEKRSVDFTPLRSEASEGKGLGVSACFHTSSTRRFDRLQHSLTLHTRFHARLLDYSNSRPSLANACPERASRPRASMARSSQSYFRYASIVYHLQDAAPTDAPPVRPRAAGSPEQPRSLSSSSPFHLHLQQLKHHRGLPDLLLHRHRRSADG